MPFEKGKQAKGSKPFQPGQSGNPDGKPAGTPNRSTSARRWLAEGYTFAHPVTGKPTPGTVEDAATIAQVRKALDGDTHAYNGLMDAAHGKVPTVLEGPDGGPVQVAASVGRVLTLDEMRALREMRRKVAGGEAGQGG